MENRQKHIIWIAPAAIAITAFAVRVLYDFELRASDPTFAYPLLDARWHFQWAMDIAQGNLRGEGVFFRAPLYPYFLGFLFWLFGPNFMAARIVQACFGAATAGLIYGIGSRLGGRRTGIIAGCITAIYGPLIYFDGELLIETLYIPLLAASLLLALIAVDKDKLWLWALVGLAMGLAAIARPNVLVFAPVLLAWMAWEIRNRRWLKAACVCIIAFSLPVAAVTIRNGIVGGEYVLIASQGGINFWIGNNEQSDGKTAMAPAHFGASMSGGSLYRDSVDISSQVLAEKRMGRKLNAGEVSNYWFGQAFDFIKRHPYDWLKLTIRKIYFLANGYEIPSNRQIYRVRDWAPILRALVLKNPIALPYGLLFPLALAGILLVRKGEASYASMRRLLALFLLTYSATVIAFFVTARHRAPILVALIPFAALAIDNGISGLTDLLRRSKIHNMRQRTMIALAVFIAVFAISNTRVFGVRADKEREFYMGLGEVFAHNGRYEEALKEFQAVISEDPYFERAWFNMGVTCLFMNRNDDALAAFDRTIEIEPRFAPAWSHIGNVYFARDNLTVAEAAYRKALEIDPSLAVAHYNLSLVLRKKGDMEGYVAELEVAAKADPYHVPSNLDLAHIYINNGQTAEARAMLMRVLRVEPNNERAKQYLKTIKGGAK